MLEILWYPATFCDIFPLMLYKPSEIQLQRTQVAAHLKRMGLAQFWYIFKICWHF